MMQSMDHVQDFKSQGFNISAELQKICAKILLQKINDEGPQSRRFLCQVLRESDVPEQAINGASNRILGKMKMRGMVEYMSSKGWTTP